jgi:hypothetical protein
MFKDLFTESKKPTEVETFKKIKDMSLKALKGYARRIKMSDEIVDDFKHQDLAIDEIMGYLYDDDWIDKIMAAGLV